MALWVMQHVVEGLKRTLDEEARWLKASLLRTITYSDERDRNQGPFENENDAQVARHSISHAEWQMLEGNARLAQTRADLVRAAAHAADVLEPEFSALIDAVHEVRAAEKHLVEQDALKAGDVPGAQQRLGAAIEVARLAGLALGDKARRR
jgi:hypothetical protein